MSVTTLSVQIEPQINTIYGSADVLSNDGSKAYMTDTVSFPNGVRKQDWTYIQYVWWQPGFWAFGPPYYFAGNGTADYIDAFGTNARFNNSVSLIKGSNEIMYVTENTPTAIQRIRQVTPAGYVKTLRHGTGITIDVNLNVYVSDPTKHRIIKITPDGTSTVFAGNGTAGYVDATGTNARFNYPNGLAVDSTGNIYVADTGNHRIRKISPTGVVTSFAGTGAAGSSGTQFNYPNGIAVASNGNKYVCDTFNGRIRWIDSTGWNRTNISTPNFPVFLALDSAGNRYFSDTENHVILKNEVRFAGSGTAGYTDGSGTNAQFNQPSGLSVDSAGNVYVADTANNLIRKISPTGVVTTVAGNGTAGYVDDLPLNSKFDTPVNIVVDPTGTYAYVIDSGNKRVRKVILPCSVNCTCQKGTYLNSSTSCSICIAGTYSDQVNANSCSQCPAGTYSAVIGATSNTVCTQCPVGTGSAAGSVSCTACQNGTFSDMTTHTCIEKCPTGTFGDTTSNACVTVCPINTFTDTTSNTCVVSCSLDKFIDQDLRKCFSGGCPAGKFYSMLGYKACVTTCTTDLWGFNVFGDPITRSCVQTCSPGLLTDQTSKMCICPSNQYAAGFNTDGANVTCTNCSEPIADGNQYVTAVCTATVDTTFSQRQMCPVGQYTSGFQSGGSKSLGSSGSCTSCPAGSYSDLVGSSSCTSCPTGSYSSAGSSTCSSSCPVGTLFTLGSACLNICLPGRYKTLTPTSISCTSSSQCGVGGQCLAGFCSNVTCNTCPAGTFYVGPGANSVSECTPCGPGTYSGLGFPTCTRCPPGTFFSGTRGTSNAVCTPCTAGTYSSSFGSTSCSTCPPDSYSYEGLGFCFRAYAGSGLIEDRGLYITHTFPSGSFNLIPFSTNVVVYDFISITATQIYSSPGVFTISQTTPITVSASSTPTMSGKVPILNSGTTLVTDYGTFNAGTPQLVVVYLKDPCPSETFWNPLKKQCVATCTTPFTTSQNGVCVKCTSRTLALTAPLVCEPGFTLSGTNCTGMENACPDPSWTLSGTTCTKTDISCPVNSVITGKGYCLSSIDFSSSVPVSTTLTQPAVSTQVTKPAFGSVCSATCPVNTFMSNGDCVQCPGNQLSVAGSTSINACQCPAGTFGANGSGACTSCGTDKTSPQGTQTQSGCVIYCPAGKYASGSSCMPCPYGTSPVGSMSVTACACPQGTFLSGGSCVAQCPAGMYSNTVTASCTSCPGNQTSTTGTTSVAGCACPEGTGGINGTGLCSSCTGGQTSTVTNLQCPDTTWTLTGSVCSKVSSYDCPNSTDYRTANTCYYTTFTYPTTGCTLKSYTCPSGWTVNGSVCLKTGQPMTTATVTVSCPNAASYTCPTGYTLSGSTCTSNTPLYYSCQNGGSSTVTDGSGNTTVKSAWVLEGTRCKRYTCSTSTPSGSYLTINGSSCKFYNSTYTCAPGYVQGEYSQNTQTAVAGIPGCNSFTNLNSNYDVVKNTSTWTWPANQQQYYGTTGYYVYYTARGKELGYCPRPTSHQPATAKLTAPYSSYMTPVVVNNTCYSCLISSSNGAAGSPAPGFYTSGACTMQCLSYDYNSQRNPKYQSYCSNALNLGVTGYDTYYLDLLDTYRSTPYSQTVATSVADDVAATPVNDTIPATHPMADQVVTGTLTRSEAQVISIQTTNATTGLSQRQCMCSSGQFWDFATKQCTTQCPVATYADSASKTCQPCPANKTSIAGSSSVSQCVCSYASPYWSGTSCMQQLNPTAAVTVSGSGITTRYVNKYVIHEFTQAASFVVQSPIIANILLVGGGAGGTDDGKPGNGGAVTTLSNQSLNTGSYNVLVGTGGGPNTVGFSSGLYSGSWTNVIGSALGGTVNTSLTSSTTFRFTNLTAAILYCPN